MKIRWNKVTTVTKMIAVFLVGLSFVWGLHLGLTYQAAIDGQENLAASAAAAK